MAGFNKQMEELQLADSKGDYSTTWKIIRELSGKDRNPKVKVKMRDGAPPKSDKDLLAEWQEYFSSLLNNDNGQAPSDLPQPAAQDLPIHDHPPTLEETLEAIRQMKTNKAAGLDCPITAEALQGGGDAMADVIHCFCAEVYSNLTGRPHSEEEPGWIPSREKLCSANPHFEKGPGRLYRLPDTSCCHLY